MQTQSILRRRHLRDATGLSLATVDRMIKRGDFPPPLRLSTQAVGWLAETIEAWLASRQPKTVAV